MSRIKILPEEVANQIAAGEVVERPASVVKELLENAVDAGSTHLALQVEGNGTRLIRVVDDGEGMDQDDVLLSLERHATSKIAGADQLGAIRTLGFRGEAVPSIASVAVLSITSRPESSPLGTRVEVRFGKVVKVHEMGCSRGTVMEIRDLFGNVPARRKFLRSAQTELAHIEEVVRNCALACPRIGLSYTVNGREALTLPAGADTVEQRFRRLLGGRVSGPLVRVDAGRGGDLRLTGFLLPPEEGAASARLALFVNGRAVRDRLLGHAAAEGLRGFLMQGRRPAGALFLEISPEEVDVNVHPTKQEVRFRQPSGIHRQVAAAVAAAITAYQEETKLSIFALPRGRTDREPAENERAEVSISDQPLPSAFQLREPDPLPLSAAGDHLVAAGAPPGFCAGRTEPLLSPGHEAFSGQQVHRSLAQSAAGSPPLRLLGQIFNSYLLCESASAMVIIDQHAAHERLLFEKLRKEYQQRTVSSQNLLFPKMLELQPEQMEIVFRQREEMEHLGFELQEMGGTTIAVRALPAVLAHLPPEEVLRDILQRYSVPESGNPGSRLHAILATMACKAAIKAGQPLEASESTGLLRQMMDLDLFSHCPHGRPVVKCFSTNDMKKWFHRS